MNSSYISFDISVHLQNPMIHKHLHYIVFVSPTTDWSSLGKPQAA